MGVPVLDWKPAPFLGPTETEFLPPARADRMALPWWVAAAQGTQHTVYWPLEAARRRDRAVPASAPHGQPSTSYWFCPHQTGTFPLPGGPFLPTTGARRAADR